MNKLFTVSVAALGLGLSFMGCDLLPTTVNDEVSISIEAIQNIGSVGTLDIKGSVEGNVEITSIEPTIYDANNTDVTGTLVKISRSVLPTGKKKLDLKTDCGFKLEILSTTCDGNYTLKILAKAGTAETTQSAAFTVAGVKNCSQVTPTLTQTQVTMGSWKNTNSGSSLEADELKVYKGDELTDALRAEVDVWFSNTGDSRAWLWSPKAAAGGGYTPKNWAVQNETQFVEVTGSVTFESITTQAQIDALWNSSSAKNFADIEANDLVVVKTNKGAYRLLKVVSAQTTDAGTSVIIGVK